MKSEIVLRGVETVDGECILVTVDLNTIPGVTGQESDEDLLIMIGQVLEADPRVMCASHAEIMFKPECLFTIFESIAA